MYFYARALFMMSRVLYSTLREWVFQGTKGDRKFENFVLLHNMMASHSTHINDHTKRIRYKYGNRRVSSVCICASIGTTVIRPYLLGGSMRVSFLLFACTIESATYIFVSCASNSCCFSYICGRCSVNVCYVQVRLVRRHRRDGQGSRRDDGSPVPRCDQVHRMSVWCHKLLMERRKILRVGTVSLLSLIC